jgi:Uma2 family endonuclease
MAQAVAKIGPADHGRRMSLDEFDKAQAKEGQIYELSCGVIAVTDVPGLRHLYQANALPDQLSGYELAKQGRRLYVAGKGECKIMVADLESERKPDRAIYLLPPPNEEEVWWTWIPELVIEGTCPESECRDYLQTPEEYLRFGVREYWIVDTDRGKVLVLRRAGGRWKERVVRPPEIYRTGLLPGFEFFCEAVFQAADKAAR